MKVEKSCLMVTIFLTVLALELVTIWGQFLNLFLIVTDMLITSLDLSGINIYMFKYCAMDIQCKK